MFSFMVVPPATREIFKVVKPLICSGAAPNAPEVPLETLLDPEEYESTSARIE